MDNNHIILKELITAQEAGEAVVLATVVKAWGSVPHDAA
jgi:xanthine/CO dehydrogenase XdhC/CoxF family maturation factor